MEVLRKQLSPDADAGAGVTYDPVTNEVLFEGEPNENFDPRINPAYQLDTGANERCGAAEGMRVEIAKWVLAATGITTTVGATNLFLTGALFLIPVSWMFGAFWAVANAALAIGGVTIGAAFTPTMLQEIACILLACLEPDGSITEAQLQRAREGVYQLGDATVTACFDLMILSWGNVGFTNAGVLNYDSAIDCDCEYCPIVYADPMTSFLGWRDDLLPAVAGDPPAVWAATGGRTGGGAVWGYNKPAAGSYIYIRIDLGRDCFVQEASVWFRKTNVNRYLSLRVVGVTEAGATVYNELVHNGTIASNGWLQYYRIIGLSTFRYLYFSIFTETLGGQLYADDISVVTG